MFNFNTTNSVDKTSFWSISRKLFWVELEMLVYHLKPREAIKMNSPDSRNIATYRT
jgi:hypothetical protein